MKVFKKFCLLFLVVLIFIVSVIWFISSQNSKNFQAIVPPQNLSLAVSTPTPTSDVLSVHSPDGAKQIIMHKKIQAPIQSGQADSSIVYSFAVSDIPSIGETVFFTKTIGGNGTMTVPLNAWSPNNAYLYLEEDENTFKDIYVFKADGSNFNANTQYLDIPSLFSAKETSNVFKNITGWDSNTLLHIITTTNGKDRGPSYWYDIPSNSFIRLAS